MTQHDPAITLRQMIEAALGLEQLTSDHDRGDLDRSLELQWALSRGLEIFGEAARRFPEALSVRYPEIPWSDIVGMRNRLTHAYESVDWDIVWIAASERAPDLIPELRRILTDLEEKGES